MMQIPWRSVCTLMFLTVHNDAAESFYPISSAAFIAPAADTRMSLGVSGQPYYSIATVDLSDRWIDLVRQGKVTATVQIPHQEEKSQISVKYGVRLVERNDKSFISQEFVEEAGSQVGLSSSSELVNFINKTLATYQSGDVGGSPVKYQLDGDFAAQLQLVRTLRPTPSAGFAGATSAIPPNYDASSDSFVTGPLRLELRPKIEPLIQDGMKTSWDVYHNISPADTRGHFLLLPTLEDKKNWRGQQFTSDDSNDMVRLAASIEPAGSLFLAYNSVGAAASQNHIHCHAWPCPPLPLIGRRSTNNDDGHDEGSNGVIHGWNCYAASRVKGIYDFFDVRGGKVEVSYLEYPVFCAQLSASDHNLELLGQALAATVETVGDAPHNIGFLNRLQIDDDTDIMGTYTDVYVFARSKERSSIVPTLKLGISEMMGVFHAQNDRELQILHNSEQDKKQGPMHHALSEISVADGAELWESIVARLKTLEL